VTRLAVVLRLAAGAGGVLVVAALGPTQHAGAATRVTVREAGGDRISLDPVPTPTAPGRALGSLLGELDPGLTPVLSKVATLGTHLPAAPEASVPPVVLGSTPSAPAAPAASVLPMRGILPRGVLDGLLALVEPSRGPTPWLALPHPRRGNQPPRPYRADERPQLAIAATRPPVQTGRRVPPSDPQRNLPRSPPLPRPSRGHDLGLLAAELLAVSLLAARAPPEASSRPQACKLTLQARPG
jgi:hypothetical protein